MAKELPKRAKAIARKPIARKPITRKPIERKQPVRKPVEWKAPAPKQPTWITTWRRLLHSSTFDTLDELRTFLEGLELHNGEVPTPEAFRQGIAKVQKKKFFWHWKRCTNLLRQHQKLSEKGEWRTREDE